jgi:hypothetical protein
MSKAVYYKCECGSEDFVRQYNVYNVNTKVAVDGEYWDEEIGEIEKDHFLGYICKECRQDAMELNDGL